MSNEHPTDLDVKRAIFRECAGAARALADAFAGADEAFPLLSRDAAAIVEQQLLDLAKRTMRIIDSAAFYRALTLADPEEKTPTVSMRKEDFK